jgi:hypothetical protein
MTAHDESPWYRANEYLAFIKPWRGMQCFCLEFTQQRVSFASREDDICVS